MTEHKEKMQLAAMEGMAYAIQRMAVKGLIKKEDASFEMLEIVDGWEKRKKSEILKDEMNAASWFALAGMIAADRSREEKPFRCFNEVSS